MRLDDGPECDAAVQTLSSLKLVSSISLSHLIDFKLKGLVKDSDSHVKALDDFEKLPAGIILPETSSKVAW